MNQINGKLDFMYKTLKEGFANFEKKLELLEELVCVLTEHIAKYGSPPTRGPKTFEFENDDCPPDTVDENDMLTDEE